MSYKNNGKFINLLIPLCELELVKVEKKKKYFLEIHNENQPDCRLLCTKPTVLGQLADLIEIPRNEFKRLIREEKTHIIKQRIKEQPSGKMVQINASEFNGNYWIFVFSTEQHKIVTFTQIRKIVKELIPTVEESEFNTLKVWELKYKTFETPDDKFDVMIRITSGKNTKSSAIKVIVYVRIYSCDNSCHAAVYSAIKRTKDWEKRLRTTITESLEVAKTCEDAFKNASNEMNIDDGIEYINNLKFALKDPEKIRFIKNMLCKRLNFEFHRNEHMNLFGLSQSLSYIGTHGDSEDLTEHTQSLLQQAAYNVLLNPTIVQ